MPGRRVYSSAYPAEVARLGCPADLVQRRKRLALGAVSLLALLALLSVAGLNSAAGATTFVVVIDSGSTGTRVYVYKWEDQGAGALPRVTLLEPSMAEVLAHRKAAGFQRGAYKRIETEPGLDKAAGDAGRVHGALDPLLQWAQRTIPSSYHSDSPIFLFGTAGLRKLPANLQSSLLADVRQLLDASPFRFEADWVRVIEGADEGIYGWVGLNYMQGQLVPGLGAGTPGSVAAPDTSEREFRQAAPHELATAGSLDLGGSSLEMTFIPDKWPASKYEEVGVEVLGTQYTLYTHSFKGYGMNDAFDKGVTVLLEARLGADPGALSAAQDGPLLLEHPCMQTGYLHDFTRKDTGWTASGGPAPAADLLAVTLTGSPDWAACKELAAKVVAASGQCARPPCTLGAESPPPRGHFFAMSGFYVVYEFFKLPLAASLEDLESAGQAYCRRDWTDIQATLGDTKNTETYCFRAPFLSALLQDGLGVSASRMRIVEGGFSWTLGAAIVEGIRLADLGSLHAAAASRSGIAGLSLRSLSPPKLLAAGVFLLAWVFLLGSAVFQYGHHLCRPWAARPHALSSDTQLKMRASDSGSAAGADSLLAGKRWNASPPEVRIPMTSLGSGKIVSSPPPTHSPPPHEEYKNSQSRRRPERSFNSLTSISIEEK
eukprot:jgi/Tetstr1/436293/TSEL_025134.t1